MTGTITWKISSKAHVYFRMLLSQAQISGKIHIGMWYEIQVNICKIFKNQGDKVLSTCKTRLAEPLPTFIFFGSFDCGACTTYLASEISKSPKQRTRIQTNFDDFDHLLVKFANAKRDYIHD